MSAICGTELYSPVHDVVLNAIYEVICNRIQDIAYSFTLDLVPDALFKRKREGGRYYLKNESYCKGFYRMGLITFCLFFFNQIPTKVIAAFLVAAFSFVTYVLFWLFHQK